MPENDAGERIGEGLFFSEQTGLAPVEGGNFLSDGLRWREASHERDHFLMRFVDLQQRRAFRACAFDGSAAIDVGIEGRMPRAFAAPSDAADLQHWFYGSWSPAQKTKTLPIAKANEAPENSPLTNVYGSGANVFQGRTSVITGGERNPT